MSGHATPRPSSVGGDGRPLDADGASDLSAVLAAASRGDQGAWRQVVGRYARRVFALARSRVRSPELAEEVTQSVFATVATRLGSGGYAEQGRFESWLFRVTMNRVRDEVRRASRQATPMDPLSLPGAAAAPASGEGEADHRAALRRALGQLADADREVIELRHHGEMSFKAMADLLGEPLGTLLARHHRALRKLKGLMASESGGTGVFDGASKEGAPSRTATVARSPGTAPGPTPGQAGERGGRQ